MPCIIRKRTASGTEYIAELAGDVWTISPQFEALLEWLRGSTARPPGDGASLIADIGFSARAGASGGGPVLSRELMERCLDANLEIWLSEYADET